MPILLVEDNERLCRSLVRAFRALNMNLDVATTGQAALGRLAKDDCEAMILDLDLPDLDGLDVLAAARRSYVPLPIIIVSARDGVEQRVSALNRGADDFLTKPFDFTELVARLRAVLRRSVVPRLSGLSFGDLRVDSEAPQVQIGDRSVTLSPREHALLQYFVQLAGDVAHRSAILSVVFGYHFDPQTNLIDVHVAHLRRKLRGSSVRLETVRGRGYRLQPSAATNESR